MKDRLSSAAVWLAVLCAVVTTGFTIRREFVAKAAPIRASRDQTPHEIANWDLVAAHGRRIGSESAKITILEFGDFECPVCKTFENGALAAIRRQYPTQVSVLFRHYPLPYHRFAMPAARASECAAEQGRFEAFHDLLYRKQDSLGLKPFASFAHDAGVVNAAAFDRCTTRSGSFASIDSDLAMAKRIAANGTPTVVVNGLMYPGAVDSATLNDRIQKLLAGSSK